MPFQAIENEASNIVNSDFKSIDVNEGEKSPPSKSKKKEKEKHASCNGKWISMLNLIQYFLDFMIEPTNIMLNQQKRFIMWLRDVLNKERDPSKWPIHDGYVHPPDFIKYMGSERAIIKNFCPSLLYLKKVYVWAPEVTFSAYFDERNANLSGIIRCPKCRNPMESCGWSNPRRVVLRDDVAYLLCKRYTCKDGCAIFPKENIKLEEDNDDDNEELEISIEDETNDGKTKVEGHNPSFLKLLPRIARESFPFILSHRSGMLKVIVQDLEDQLLTGRGFAPFQKSLKQLHLRKYYLSQISYLQLLDQIVRNPRYGYCHFPRLLSENLPDFGKFDDKDRYQGYCPSVHLLQTIYVKYIYEMDASKNIDGNWLKREDIYHLAMQTIDGQVLSADASHKV